ncbi:GIY-YIG nuclease family protein [Candidatus Daviesbacteria bacterium]|nr:GIY-YIG nuclease family protein [Candidatus Daviesbacteria bacterium]
MWVVYILLCQDGSLYTGITNNLQKRFNEHKKGKGGRYTRSHPPLRIVYQEKIITHPEALKREAEIKSWSKKEKLNLCK